VDDEGFFRITDRMKDIIITAGGKNITPSEWENELKFSPYMTDAVVIGDKRAYLTVLIMIDQENVEKFAQDHDVPFSNYTSLTRAKEVQDLIQGEIDKVNARIRAGRAGQEVPPAGNPAHSRGRGTDAHDEAQASVRTEEVRRHDRRHVRAIDVAYVSSKESTMNRSFKTAVAISAMTLALGIGTRGQTGQHRASARARS
jgi:acyl-CoA synthetase (AMP-forming)/AMP-acid ligase II